MPGRSKRWLAIVLLCSQLGTLGLSSALQAQRAQTTKRTTATKKNKGPA